ncbi:hypothetical protein EVAR_17626_1 [Eumeta japonica]|uniref:Uncharacterized protein n=1 Tax=Eumeta variegata TaxID=151549 RepID=A0A4C1USX3_EUMVA|nr:hypothetical protein EVAR_17626_1 [Eumeta japonica]
MVPEKGVALKECHHSGLPGVCAPSLRPVSAPRKGFNDFSAPLAPLCFLAAWDEAVKAYGLTAGARLFQGVFSPCELDVPRAPGHTECP